MIGMLSQHFLILGCIVIIIIIIIIIVIVIIIIIIILTSFLCALLSLWVRVVMVSRSCSAWVSLWASELLRLWNSVDRLCSSFSVCSNFTWHPTHSSSSNFTLSNIFTFSVMCVIVVHAGTYTQCLCKEKLYLLFVLEVYLSIYLKRSRSCCLSGHKSCRF